MLRSQKNINTPEINAIKSLYHNLACPFTYEDYIHNTQYGWASLVMSPKISWSSPETVAPSTTM